MTSAPAPFVAPGIEVWCIGVGQTFAVGGQELVALADVNLHFEAGQSLALFGPSGSGKSTLLSLLAGLRHQSTGQVWLSYHELGRMSERQLLELRGYLIGLVMQNPARALLQYGTAVDNIRFAQSVADRDARRHLPAPEELLDELGLVHLAGQPAGRLSGGEQQRLSIAVAMSCMPSLLLADEPTSQLDGANRDLVLQLLARVRKSFGATMVVVTHDPVVADALDRRITLSEGRVVADTLPSWRGRLPT